MLGAVALAFVVAFLCALRFDEQLLHQLNALAPDESLLRRILKSPRWVVGWHTVITLGVLLLIHPLRRRLFGPFVVLVASSAALTHGLKFLVGRARPEAKLGAYHFESVFADFRANLDSFPSGHTAEAFLIAGLISLYFPRLRAPAFVAAVLIGLSRVAQGRHFVSDVIAGAGLATLLLMTAVTIWGMECFPRLRISHFVIGVRELLGAKSIRETAAQRPVE